MVKYHLVVLVHGLWGNPSHMDYIESQIKENLVGKSQDEQLVVYKTGSHTGFSTYDGIDVIGKRVFDEIERETASLEQEKDKVVKISITGYSLGGLISRYAIGYLYSTGYFDKIEPVQFTTFCTPHAGTRNPGTSWGNRIFNYFVPHILVHTGTHLFLSDNKQVVIENEVENFPLLVWMTHPKSVFYKGLKCFGQRNLYANIINDKRSAYFTAAISLRDPFHSMINENFSAYDLDFIQGYEPNVIDITKPVKFKAIERQGAVRSAKGSEAPTRVWSSLARKLNWVKVVASLVIITPFWAAWMITNSVLERFRNKTRVDSFFNNDLDHLYSQHVSENSTDDDYSLARVNTNGETLFEDITNSVKDHTDGIVESIFSAMNSDTYKNYHYDVSKTSVSDQSSDAENLTLINLKGKVQEFDLNLSDDQATIIKNLNSLEWNKYPVLIRNTKQTHRAAIVRFPDPTFEEGKVVVKHFIKEVFQI